MPTWAPITLWLDGIGILLFTTRRITLQWTRGGTNTNALKVLRAISPHPDGAYHRHSMLNADEIALASRLAKDAEMQRTSDNEQAWYLANETQAKGGQTNQ